MSKRKNRGEFKCIHCDRSFGSEQALFDHHRDAHFVSSEVPSDSDPDTDPDWEGECDVCGASPIVPMTGMCGPCTWGEAETIGGNW